MKTAFTLSLFLAAVVAMAQSGMQIPQKEFTINLSESTLTLKPGESKQLTVSILRSKYYSKADAVLGFSNKLPEGITAQYEPSTGFFETSVVTVTASPTTAIGVYQLILNGTLNHKTKGNILRISVGTESVASK
ncbi:MAG: hypothetical protein WDN75_00890 [Bacteroidota bacterium]